MLQITVRPGNLKGVSMSQEDFRASDYNLGFIGGGKMAEALAAAIIRKRVLPEENLLISDPMEERRTLLSQEYGIRVTVSNMDVADFADVIVLAVKPQLMGTVLAEIGAELKHSKLVLSIAAGIRIRRISDAFPGARVVRIMPNTPCLVGEMAAGYAVGPSVSENDLSLVDTLLSAAGTAIRVEEALLDAVTGLSGSGPAFVAHLIDAFIEGGIREGLSRDIARELTLRTFIGTARLLGEHDLSPKELIAKVSSPGGTTIAGRNILETEPVSDIIARTISAAAERSRELAGN